MAKTDIWMPLYVGDYLRDTMRLDAAASGAYLHLMMEQWIAGPLPDDDEVLARIAKCSSVAWLSLKVSLKSYFQVADGYWTQLRLEHERLKAANLKKRATAGAKAVNEKRWGNGVAKSVAKSVANESLKSRTSPSPSQETNTNTLPHTCEKTASAAAADETPVVFEIGLVGSVRFGVTERLYAQFQAAYPGISVMAELAKADTWLQCNPQRKPTLKGIKRFLNSWLSRVQDKAPMPVRNGQQPAISANPPRRFVVGVSERGEAIYGDAPQSRGIVPPAHRNVNE